MGTLTKTFIIVLVVLMLAACPIFITQATVAPNWRLEAENLRVSNSALAQDARLRALAHQRLDQEYQLLTERSSGEISRVQTRAEQQAVRLASLQDENARLQTELARIVAELSQLRADYQQNTARTELLALQRDEAFARLEQLNVENRRLSDLAKQTQLEADRQSEIARMLSEQLAEREERIRTLETGVSAAPAAKPAEPAQAISGTLTAIQGDLASVNVGSAQGIRPDMRLIIYRGADFVGHLRIQQVDVSESAGIVVDRRLEPQRGDKVTTSLD